MSEEDLKKFVRSLEGAVCDYPFEDDFETFVMRHGAGGKWFGVYISALSSARLRRRKTCRSDALFRRKKAGFCRMFKVRPGTFVHASAELCRYCSGVPYE